MRTAALRFGSCELLINRSLECRAVLQPRQRLGPDYEHGNTSYPDLLISMLQCLAMDVVILSSSQCFFEARPIEADLAGQFRQNGLSTNISVFDEEGDQHTMVVLVSFPVFLGELEAFKG